MRTLNTSLTLLALSIGVATFSPSYVFAQSDLDSPSNTSLNAQQFNKHIELAFHNGIVDDKNDIKAVYAQYPELAALQKKFNFTLKSTLSISKEKQKKLNQARQSRYFTGLSQGVIKDISESKYDFNAYWQVYLAPENQHQLHKLTNALDSLEIVKYAEVLKIPVRKEQQQTPTPIDTMLAAAADYSTMQGYLYAEEGVNITHAWNKGIYGQGVTVADIEYSWNFDHVEFTGQNAQVAPGMTMSSLYENHGTAVMGMVYAADDNQGVVGGMHQADAFYGIPQRQPTPDGERTNMILAYDTALELLNPGDVLIIEAQYSLDMGNRGSSHYVPVEFSAPIFERTQMLTDAGINVVAAAANGAQNFDDPRYAEQMAKGDSGSIIVGAGSSDSTHSRLSFSNHGQRVDLQGWGRNVTTTGYGGLANTPNADYTSAFSGTSSATPVVANAVIGVVSYMKNQYNIIPTPQEVRNILKHTGRVFESSNVIGPLPDLKAAFDHIDAQYGNDGDLQNGVAIRISEQQGQAYQNKISVPAGATNIKVSIEGGNGDADLYVRYGAPASRDFYDCAPYEVGNNETCNMSEHGFIEPGDYHVFVYGYSAFDQVYLKASYQQTNTSLRDMCSIQGPTTYVDLVLDQAECIDTSNGQHYAIYLPQAKSQLTIESAHGEGNVDLYTMYQNWPSSSYFDASSVNSGNHEKIVISNPQAGYHYIYLDGSSNNVSLVVTAQ